MLCLKTFCIENISFLYFPYFYWTVGLLLHNNGNINILWSKLQMFPQDFYLTLDFSFKDFCHSRKNQPQSVVTTIGILGKKLVMHCKYFIYIYTSYKYIYINYYHIYTSLYIFYYISFIFINCVITYSFLWIWISLQTDESCSYH